MRTELSLTPHEMEPTSHSSGVYEATSKDVVLCARTNVLRMLNGDSLSKELIEGLAEESDYSIAKFRCPVSECVVVYDFHEDGSESRSGDCEVIMSSINKIAHDNIAGKDTKRGLTWTEFKETSLGKQTIK